MMTEKMIKVLWDVSKHLTLDERAEIADKLRAAEELAEAAQEAKQFSGYLKQDGTYWIIEKLIDALEDYRAAGGCSAEASGGGE